MPRSGRQPGAHPWYPVSFVDAIDAICIFPWTNMGCHADWTVIGEFAMCVLSGLTGKLLTCPFVHFQWLCLMVSNTWVERLHHRQGLPLHNWRVWACKTGWGCACLSSRGCACTKLRFVHTTCFALSLYNQWNSTDWDVQDTVSCMHNRCALCMHRVVAFCMLRESSRALAGYRLHMLSNGMLQCHGFWHDCISIVMRVGIHISDCCKLII